MIQAMSAADACRTPAPDAPPPRRRESPVETCDYCGADTLAWVKCKLICRNCRQINKSCADL